MTSGAIKWRTAGVLLLISLFSGLPVWAGVTEGETDGEGETAPTCDLTDLELASPSDGATWYLSDTSGGLDVSLLAQVDCAEDVYSISFSVQPEGGASQAIGTPDSTEPYEADFNSFFTPTIGQDLIWRAVATRVTQPAATLTAQSTVSLADTDSVDADENGLPDAPFPAMNSSDDRWFAAAKLESQDDRVVTWMRTISGEDPDALGNEVVAALRSPDNTGQTLTVTFDRRMIEGTQIALLVVRFAPTLAALAGDTEAAEFTREPSGALDGAGQYVAISVLVSNNNGTTYSEIGASRLLARPVTLKLTGLDLDATREYTMARHDAKLSSVSDSLTLIAETSAWKSVATESIDLAAGTATATIEELGVFAPFYIVDEDELCPLGFCIPGSIIIELLSIVALFILNLVPGGVGGGDSPCFIATAAYGTPLAADIEVLRAFRDEWLLNNVAGTAFTDVYYRLSPALADVIAQYPLLAAVARVLIGTLVSLTQWGYLGLALVAIGISALALRMVRAVQH